MNYFNILEVTDPKQQYGYIPTEWLGIVAVVIFGIILALEFIEGIVFLLWLQIVPMIGTIGEIIGWAFRLQSHFKPLDFKPYVGQMVCLIITPNCMLNFYFILFYFF